MKRHHKPNGIGQSNPLKTVQNIVCRDQERMFFEAPSIPKIWPVCFHRSGHNSASYNKQILSSYNYTIQYILCSRASFVSMVTRSPDLDSVERVVARAGTVETMVAIGGAVET